MDPHEHDDACCGFSPEDIEQAPPVDLRDPEEDE